MLTLNKQIVAGKNIYDAKGLIKSFVFSSKFPQICAVHLSIAVHSLVFCKFYLFANNGESKKERKQLS